MSNTYRNLMIILFVSIFVAGCSGRGEDLIGARAITPPLPVTTLDAETPVALTEEPSPIYTADGSACHWSYQECWACGGGGGDEFVVPIDAASDAIVSELVGRSPAFSPDGKLVATVDGEEVRVLQADDGKPAYVLAGDAFVFSPDNRLIATRQADGWHIGNATTGQQQYVISDPGGSIYFSPDGQTMVKTDDVGEGTGSAGTSVRIYDVKTGAKRSELQVVNPKLSAISPNGRMLATVQSKEVGVFDVDVIVLWDTTTGAELQVLQAQIQSEAPLAGVRGHRTIDSITFSPDGRALLSAGFDAIRLWDTATGEHLRCFQTPDHFGASEAFFGADGRTIVGKIAANVGPKSNDEVYLWDANTNHPVGMLGLVRESASGPLRLSFSARSNRLLSSSGLDVDDTGDREAYLWDLNSRQLLGVLPNPGYLTEAAFSPDGDRAATVFYYEASPYERGQRKALLWDTNQGSVALAGAAQESIWDALAASEDGDTAKAQQSFRKAEALNPDVSLRVSWKDAKNAYARYLGRAGRFKALSDNIDDATTKYYAEIQNKSPKWLEWSSSDLAFQLEQYSVALAGKGDIAGAVAAYRRATALDSDVAGALGSDPETEAKRLAAQGVSTEGDNLAKGGDIAGAVAKFNEALTLDPSLEINPETRARQIYAPVLAQEGRIDEATALFREALSYDPTLDIQPEAEARRLYASALVKQGTVLAERDHELDKAVAAFQQALAYDPTLDIDPEAKARRLYASALVRDGEGLARRGKIDEAVAMFQQALTYDPTLDIKPEARAGQLYAETLVMAGNGLAEAGQLDGAIARFRQAVTQDPTLDIVPEAEAGRIYGEALTEQGNGLAEVGLTDEAISTYQRAVELNPALETDPEPKAQLCKWGALWRRAELVLETCEQAVTLSDGAPKIRDSRGVARSLTGDTAGAIEDFEAFVDLLKQQAVFDSASNKIRTYDTDGRQREEWIAALKAGKNPFDEEMLKALRSE